MRLRSALVPVVLVLSAAALAGCEQPPPTVTAFSGTNSVRVEALCWAYDQASVSSQACAQDIAQGAQLADAPDLKVTAGSTVGISVDTKIAEQGWYPSIGGQRMVNTPITSTYFRFTFPAADLPDDGVGLQVLAGSGGNLKGVWAVRLID